MKKNRHPKLYHTVIGGKTFTNKFDEYGVSIRYSDSDKAHFCRRPLYYYWMIRGMLIKGLHFGITEIQLIKPKNK